MHHFRDIKLVEVDIYYVMNALSSRNLMLIVSEHLDLTRMLYDIT